METQKIQLGNAQTENSNNLIFSSLVSFCLLLNIIVCMHAQSLSHVQLCNPTDSGPPGFPVCVISKARKQDWVAIFFFNVSFV